MSMVLPCVKLPGFTELQTWIAAGYIVNRYEQHSILGIVKDNGCTIIETHESFYVFRDADGECYFIAETLEMAKWYSVQVSRL